MKVELKERSPEAKAAYHQGYNAACNILKGQMLGKMNFYRSMLWDCLRKLEESDAIGVNAALCNRIHDELKTNPEWEVLEHIPHMIPMCQDPNIYKEVDQ